MAVGVSTYMSNKLLDTFCNNTSFVVATPYIKLHIGQPGSAGTSNPALNTTRKLVSFGAATAATCSNDTDIVWTNVPNSEDYTHWSLWDASTGGNFLMSGTITAVAVVATQSFTILAGSLDLSLNVA